MVSVPLARGADPEAAKRLLEQTAAEVCAAFVAPAEAALRELEGEQFVVLPSVSLRLVDAGKVTLLLRYPCPADRRTRTEQEILARYLAASQRTAKEAPED